MKCWSNWDRQTLCKNRALDQILYWERIANHKGHPKDGKVGWW